MKRVRIKEVRPFSNSTGLSIRAGPYWKGLPLYKHSAFLHSKKWILKQPWGAKFLEMISHPCIEVEEVRKFLVGRYINVYKVIPVVEAEGPYKGCIYYYID